MLRGQVGYEIQQELAIQTPGCPLKYFSSYKQKEGPISFPCQRFKALFGGISAMEPNIISPYMDCVTRK